MSEPTVVAARAGEVIGDSPDRRVEILTDHETLHATWSRFGPHRDGADPHVHRRHTDVFYVLGGELTIRLGREDEAVVAPAGTLARVPAMVVHGFRNATDGEVRYLNFHAPGTGFADYMRALRDGRTPDFDQEPPPADGVRPASEAVVGRAEVLPDGPGGARVVLLADTPEVAIAEMAGEPGGEAPPVHVHERHAESFYALDGELLVTVGGRALRLEPGSWLTVPPGVAHTVAVPGPAPARFLNLHAPAGGFAAFLRELHAGAALGAAIERAGFDEHRTTEGRATT
jgi:mannose-6-phosphate isomerase-like protein (cupin superfamily)